MRETGAPTLREQWAEQAAAIGMTIEEIVEGGKGRRPRAGRKRRECREREEGGAERSTAPLHLRVWLCVHGGDGFRVGSMRCSARIEAAVLQTSWLQTRATTIALTRKQAGGWPM